MTLTRAVLTTLLLSVTVDYSYSQSARSPNSNRIHRRIGPESNKLLRYANQLFKKRKFKEAAAIYSKILRSNSDHEFAKVQLAKSYYRMGDLNSAYKTFSFTQLNRLDQDTSFEYGVSHYSKRKYSDALRGFSRVQEGHPQYDLASYYSGVSSMRLKEYPEAANFFSRAVVLPSKLMTNKNNYLKEVEQRTKKQSATKKAKASPRPTQFRREDSYPEFERTETEPPKEERIKILKSVRRLSLVAESESQEKKTSNKSSNHASQSLGGVSAELGFNITPPKYANITYHLQLHGIYGVVAHEDQIEPLTTNYLDDLRNFMLAQIDPNSYARLGALIALQWNPSYRSALALGVAYDHLESSGKGAESFYVPAPFIAYRKDLGLSRVTFTLRFAQVDETGAHFLSRTDQEFHLIASYDDSLSFDLAGLSSQFQYARSSIEGEEWKALGSLAVIYDVSKYIDLKAYTYYRLVNNNREEIEEGSYSDFSHDDFGVGGLIDFVVSDIFKLHLEYGIEDRALQGIKPNTPEARSALLASFPLYIQRSQASLMLNLNF